MSWSSDSLSSSQLVAADRPGGHACIKLPPHGWATLASIPLCVRAHLPTAATNIRSPNVSRYTLLDQGARKGHLCSALGLPHSPTYQAVRAAPAPRLSPSPPLPLTLATRCASQHTSNTSAMPPAGRPKPTCTLPYPSPPITPCPSHAHAHSTSRPMSRMYRSLRVQRPCGAGRGVGCGAEGLAGRGSNADRDQGGPQCTSMHDGLADPSRSPKMRAIVRLIHQEPKCPNALLDSPHQRCSKISLPRGHSQAGPCQGYHQCAICLCSAQ